MKTTYTLQDIQDRKAQTLRELRATKREINAMANDVMRPKVTVPKYLTIKSLKNAYNIYCKARHAYKIATTVASFIRRR